MTISKPRDNATVWMSGGYDHKDLKLETAVVTERISTLTEIRVEFMAKRPRLDLSTVVGKNMTVHVALDDGSDNGRMFTGTCVSAEALETGGDQNRYFAEVRPWFWLLTLTRNNRVFQNKNVKEIIEEVIGDHGFGSEVKFHLAGTYEPREYCVQYRESDFDFLSRLMEEEGLFYYFDHDDALEQHEKLVICEGTAGLGNLGGNNNLVFKDHSAVEALDTEEMVAWAESEAIVRGKVTLGDHEFTAPTVQQIAASAIKSGSHAHTGIEYYDLPGHYRKDQGRGDRLAKIRMEADALRFREYEGSGTVRYMGAGHTFSLSDHPISKLNMDYLVVSAVHHLKDASDFKGEPTATKLDPLVDGQDRDYSYYVTAIDRRDQFRAPLTTPWPEVPGVQTGFVVGPSGKEIHTDEHGRVKVHFRWDRVNKKDDNASCWIRVATGWSGNKWGLNSVPRIGQEVLIQFEDGDPDRPIVTGMLYNADTMPPYVDKAQPTRTGLMTRSSPNGGANDYNALVFEDKAGSEYTHFQSQKDYQMVVKDSAQITIGDNGKNVDPGGQTVDSKSLLMTVEQHVTEDVMKGDKTETVHMGNFEQTVSKGNWDQKVSVGNMTTDVTGKIDVSAKGAITIESLTSITLKVGGSSIKIDNAGVTITGAATAKMTAMKTDVNGDAMLTLKGGMVMIN